MGAEGVVTIDGCLLSTRTWQIIQWAWVQTRLQGRPLIAQGSWHHGSLSGSTHDQGGAADVRIVNIPADKVEAFVVNLRRANCCAWFRDMAHGGFEGSHIHLIVRDEPDLSKGARAQVIAYDLGRNGLDDRGPDYHPRPEQHPIEYYTEADMPLTPDEIQKVADAVWEKVLDRPWDGKQQKAGAMLGSAHFYAVQGGYVGDTPAGATTSPGQPTTAKQILGAGSGGALSDADVERIAKRTADLLATRLAQ